MRLHGSVQSAKLSDARLWVAEKTHAAGRHVRQIELCSLHSEIVIERDGAALDFAIEKCFDHT